MSSDRKWRVRYNLGRGENYMKWAVNERSKTEYISPDEYNMKLTNCKLRNQKGTAKKICEGAHKAVCAWLQSEELKVLKPFVTMHIPEGSVELMYNPRTAPHWRKKGSDEDMDNKVFEYVFIVGKNIYGFGENYNPPAGKIV